MRTKLLLINPWIHDFAAVNLWARPLGLLKVAEWLSAYDLDLELLDCLDTPVQTHYHTGKFPKTFLPSPGPLQGIQRSYARYGIPLKDFENRLRSLLPVSAILITSIMTYWYPGMQEAIRCCRRLCPGTPIFLGGLYPKFFPEHARQAGADAVYSGKADENLSAFLAGQGIGLDKIRSPRPYYQLGLYPRLDYAPLLTSQGCPNHCAYCASDFLNPGFQQRPPQEVIQEIADLASLGVQDLAFYDDALLVNAHSHLQPILRAVIAAGLLLRFHTPNGLHARLLDAETAILMKAAGFKTIRLSLETVNPQRQQATGGKVNNQGFARAIKNLVQAGFEKKQLGVYLMYGLPGQPLSEIWEGLHFLQTLPVRVHLTEFSPLPQTAAWQELLAAKIIPPDLDPLLTNNTVFSQRFIGYPGEEIKQMKDFVARHNQAACH